MASYTYIMIQNNTFLLSGCMSILTVEREGEEGQGTGELKGDRVGGAKHHLL